MREYTILYGGNREVLVREDRFGGDNVIGVREYGQGDKIREVQLNGDVARRLITSLNFTLGLIQDQEAAVCDFVRVSGLGALLKTS